MRKLLCVLAAAVLLFTCAFAEEDTSVIASFDGGVITFNEVYDEFTQMAELYSLFYNFDVMSDPATSLQLQQDIVDEMLRDRIMYAYIEKEGVVLMTPEREAELTAYAQREYQALLDETVRYYLEEGLDEASALPLAEQDLVDSGMDVDSLIDFYITNEKTENAHAYLAGEVTVNEADVRDLYDWRLEEDTAYYSEAPWEYAFDALFGDALLTYIPEGMREVRVYSFDTAEEAESALGGILSGEYMEFDPYLLCANCYLLEDSLLEAALALENPGESTGILPSSEGFAVITYVGELKAGPVAYEEVYETLYSEVELSLIEGAFENKLDKLIEQANVQYFWDRLG